MRSWSVPLVVEAAVCGGLHTLLAPLSLGVLFVPMDASGPALVLAFLAAATVALVAYWQLALATIERKAYRFGPLYWSGVAASACVLALLTRAEAWWFWCLVLAPPLLSGAHFSYLQAKGTRRAV
jgi:hypothetical protein